MSDLNQCTFIGRLGADPEVRSFQNGGRVANLRMAVGERWKDKQTGERKERTEWIGIAIHNDGLVGVAEKYLKKGSRLLVQGQFRTRKWQDQSWQDRYTTEIVLQGPQSQLVMLDSASGQNASGQVGSSETTQHFGGSGASHDDLDDSIPF